VTTGRGGRTLLRPQWAVSIGAALAVIGFVGYAQWNGSPERAQFITTVQQAVAEQVAELEQEQEDLRAQIAAAEARVLEFQAASTTSSSALAEVNRRLEEARLAVGLTPLRGPGVVIEIADSQRVIPDGENATNYIVLVDDLRDIVVALWASGAEAIAINGERLVATSSIYGVGASVLVNTAFLSPPFRIEAIGPDELLDRFSTNAAFQGRVAHRIEVFGLEFASQAADELQLAAFVGNTRFRWAVPTAEAP
jgi:uncharacterized protein YlxW (UPF0749 family)